MLEELFDFDAFSFAFFLAINSASRCLSCCRDSLWRCAPRVDWPVLVLLLELLCGAAPVSASSWSESELSSSDEVSRWTISRAVRDDGVRAR